MNVLKRAAAVAAVAMVVAACGGPTRQAAHAEPAAPGIAHTEDAPDMIEHDGHAMSGREWDGPAAAQVDVSVSGDSVSGWTVAVEVPQFVFTLGTDHVAGEGHAHLIVDGEMLSMIFEPQASLPDLEPGEHEIMVTLAANDHVDYVQDGEPVSGSTTLVVPG